MCGTKFNNVSHKPLFTYSFEQMKQHMMIWKFKRFAVYICDELFQPNVQQADG